MKKGGARHGARKISLRTGSLRLNFIFMKIASKKGAFIL